MKKIFGIAMLWLLLACTAASAQQFGPWSPPVNLGPTINTSFDDMHPSLSKDGLSLYFSSNRPGVGGLDLWVLQRDSFDSPWQPPQNLTILNTPFDDHAANLTMDGHWLFFYSTRPGGCNAGQRQELWAAHRQNKRDDFGWEPPINLGCTLNAPGADDGGPGYWEDDTTGTHHLYFARNYTPANPNGFSIYVSTCTADLDNCNQQQLWSPAEYVAELSSPGFRSTKTAIRQRDGLEIIVTSNRPGTTGALDLWVATRATAENPWSIPVNVNLDNQDKCSQLGIDPASCPIVNTTANDGAAALSWDGQTMIFYSNRTGGYGGNDLYMSTRPKLTGSQ
jgi:WD40 repeat protein